MWWLNEWCFVCSPIVLHIMENGTQPIMQNVHFHSNGNIINQKLIYINSLWSVCDSLITYIKPLKLNIGNMMNRSLIECANRRIHFNCILSRTMTTNERYCVNYFISLLVCCVCVSLFFFDKYRKHVLQQWRMHATNIAKCMCKVILWIQQMKFYHLIAALMSIAWK